MPFYDINCPHCDETDEYRMEPFDKTVECSACGEEMNRKENQDYSDTRIGIIGDTCAGCCDFSNYFDDALDMQIDSRDHRKRVMKEKGLTEYVPNPDMAAARKESRYILDHSPKNDKAALVAAKDQSKVADKKRKERVINAAMERTRKVL